MQTLRSHWPEYLIEGAALGLFMIVAATFTTLLEHPSSPVRQALPDAFVRRVLTGLAMGATVVAIVYSPWGARSGAHLNPSLTLTFYRLGNVSGVDAVAYAVAQFAGGLAGILASAVLLGPLLAVPQVDYVATLPGPRGQLAAFGGEVAIAFVQMTMVLHATGNRRLAPLTGVFAGMLVATYITVEAPLSGMSLNPARSLGPALFVHALDSLWIYFAAPTIGMLLAAETFRRTRGIGAVLCAKLYHGGDAPCPFNCRFHEMHP